MGRLLAAITSSACRCGGSVTAIKERTSMLRLTSSALQLLRKAACILVTSLLFLQPSLFQCSCVWLAASAENRTRLHLRSPEYARSGLFRSRGRKKDFETVCSCELIHIQTATRIHSSWQLRFSFLGPTWGAP